MAQRERAAHLADGRPGPPRVPQHPHRDVSGRPSEGAARRQPTGAHVKTFELPKSWEKRRTFLRFEGVTSGCLVWVNGSYAGYDQGGYTPAEFDISERLHPGRNTVAVQVHRWGSGAHMEDYDQWRFAGIFRSVGLYSTPATHLRDVTIKTDLDAAYRDARLTARVDGCPGPPPSRKNLLDGVLALYQALFPRGGGAPEPEFPPPTRSRRATGATAPPSRGSLRRRAGRSPRPRPGMPPSGAHSRAQPRSRSSRRSRKTSCLATIFVRACARSSQATRSISGKA
ncbi:hypothetical protein SAZ11_56420 [Streptomyces sp. FXJ1.4098]|nr:hypothetical protein [Streptomyces sp. FXJ1.4098]